jgi:hypothetical protein
LFKKYSDINIIQLIDLSLEKIVAIPSKLSEQPVVISQFDNSQGLNLGEEDIIVATTSATTTPPSNNIISKHSSNNNIIILIILNILLILLF